METNTNISVTTNNIKGLSALLTDKIVRLN